MLQNQGLGFLIHIADGVRAGLFHGGFGGDDAAGGVDFADHGVLGIEGVGDARAQVDGVADESLIAGLERLHERFAAVGAAVVNGDGAAIERLAAGVGQLGGVGGMLRAVIGVDQQLAALDGLLQ